MRTFVLSLCRDMNNDIERPSYFVFLPSHLPPPPLKKTRSSIHKKRPTKNSSGSNRLLKSYFGLTMVNRSKLVIVVDISLEASEQCVFDKKKKVNGLYRARLPTVI